MLSLKVGIEDLKQAKTLMSEANHIMSDHISKLKALEEENAALKDELGALQIRPDASYMKLPLDADGKPIRIGDVVNVDGDAMTVLGYRHDDTLLLIAKDRKSGLFFSPEPSRVRHFKPEPADSWEKLEEDAAKEVCAYAGAPFSIVDQDRYSCTGCRFDDCSNRKASCWLQMNSELMARAKRLAGAE